MRLVLVVLAVFSLSGPAVAFSELERAAARDVIEEQLGAFARDDAAGAYALAADGIRRMFPTEEIFMDLVKRGYAPVYRNRSHSFGEPHETTGIIVQPVDLTDAEGVEWEAVYTLERQQDGSLRITGCHLVRKPGLST